jgi:serine/threonine protein kinase
LKPSNIIKSGRKWKIADFGFATKNDQLDDINVGTPIYMPPEALKNSLYSHKSDFFSLGVIMY